MIPKKQRTTEADWTHAIQNIERDVSKPQLDALIDKTINNISNKTKGLRTAYSWSGGKDSIVLQKVCEMAGINHSVFVCCDLEYTAFMKWVMAHKPENCEVINTHQDIVWLSKHQEMLFPQDSAIAGKWFHIIQHKGQEIYYKKHHLDAILLGRRRADGNYVGKGDNIYTNAKGITRYSPLADWTHEDVLACIYYYNLELPPIYNWKNGYICGTHNFAERQWTGSIENGWREVFEIEPDWVFKASQYIESAELFLRSINNG